MILESKDKKALGDIRMKKALEFMEDAQVNFKDSRNRTSVNTSWVIMLP